MSLLQETVACALICKGNNAALVIRGQVILAFCIEVKL